MKIKIAAILLSVFMLATGGVRADVTATASVQAGPLTLNLKDVIFTQKKGYVHVLLDAWPYAAQISAQGLSSLSSVAEALLSTEGMKRFPKEKNFKLDVVELSQRDDYGAPRWELVKLKERYKASVGAKGLSFVVVPLDQEGSKK